MISQYSKLTMTLLPRIVKKCNFAIDFYHLDLSNMGFLYAKLIFCNKFHIPSSITFFLYLYCFWPFFTVCAFVFKEIVHNKNTIIEVYVYKYVVLFVNTTCLSIILCFCAYNTLWLSSSKTTILLTWIGHII